MTAKLPGYGYSRPYSPPYGSRHPDDVEDGAVEEAKGPTRWRPEFSTPVPPTSRWGSLLKSGYSEVYADVYDGIPFIFASRPMWTTRGVAAARNNADDVQMSYALVIPEGDYHEQVCNRAEGLASGRALDMIFGRQQLAEEGLGAALFRRPTQKLSLAVAVTDPNADEFIVTDTAEDWPFSGLFFIGRECVKYAARAERPDGRWSFTGCERGVAGMPHYHTASESSAYSRITDVPVYWRGRLVTRYAHLVSPEGRFLGERWCELGEFCRHEWRGYVRDTPRPTAAGMVLTCLPLIRIAGQEFGAEVSGKLARYVDGLPFIVSEPSDVIEFRSTSETNDYQAPQNPTTSNGGIIALSTWAGIVANNTSVTFKPISAVTHETHLEIRVEEEESIAVVAGTFVTHPTIAVEAKAWFLEPGTVPDARITPQPTGSAGGYSFKIPWSFGRNAGSGAGSWLVFRLDPSVDFTDAEIADGGFLALDVEGHIEVVGYDALRRSNDNTLTAFRIRARNLLGTQSIDESTSTSDSYWNPWLNDTSVRVLTGATGDWALCLRTLMTSSGTGDRGPYDQLAYGFGLGVPDEAIAVPVPGTDDFTAIDRGVDSETGEVGNVVAVTTGKTSIQKMLCGIQALNRRCLVQRRQADGRIAIDVVSTDVIDYGLAEPIGETDIMLDGVDTPEMMEAPNQIRIVRADTLTESVPIVSRDPARAQAEGVRALEINVPGVAGLDALKKSTEMMALGDGQAIVRMRLPPWTNVEIGQLREITVTHPAIWDWTSGAFGVAAVMARVIGLARYYWDQQQVATFLLAGQAQERVYLCPSALVIEVVSTTVYKVERGGATGFADGFAVRLYEVGNEDADSGESTIASILVGDDYDTITLDSDPSVDGDELCLTYAVRSACTESQARLMFTVASRAWR